ncbi:hypothetical protein KCP74_19265 [Salmonella enterica subsp. enterica]|nr:hypothetical protein KCP74_19265 [Salmonella enterica subsp. enterica]
MTKCFIVGNVDGESIWTAVAANFSGARRPDPLAPRWFRWLKRRISFSPERHEGSPRHRYAMLIDLRRCIGCRSCTVSCTIEENQTPQGAFRTTNEPIPGPA